MLKFFCEISLPTYWSLLLAQLVVVSVRELWNYLNFDTLHVSILFDILRVQRDIKQCQSISLVNLLTLAVITWMKVCLLFQLSIHLMKAFLFDLFYRVVSLSRSFVYLNVDRFWWLRNFILLYKFISKFYILMFYISFTSLREFGLVDNALA